MKLEIYNQEKHLDKLNNYRLTNLESTDSPKAIFEKSIMYDDRFAIAILNDEDVMVGFFVCIQIQVHRNMDFHQRILSF